MDTPVNTEALDRTQSLPPLLQSSLLVEHSRTIISEHGYEGSWPQRIRVLIDPTADMVAMARQTLDDYAELNRPLQIEDLAMRLGEMRAVLKAKGAGMIDTSVSISVLCREVGDYPADILVWALDFWQRTEVWFPAPSDLHNLIDRRWGGRKAILEALERLVAKGEPA